jgi:hypothetical protein
MTHAVGTAVVVTPPSGALLCHGTVARVRRQRATVYAQDGRRYVVPLRWLTAA